MKKVSLVSYLKKYWFFAAVSPLMMMGEVVVDLLQPKLMANIVNKVVETGVTGEVDPEVMSFILFTALKMILLVAFGGFCGIMCCYTASVASQGFGSDIRVDAFNKVMSLSLEQTDRFTTGSLVFEEGEQLSIEPNLESGEMTIEFISAEGMDNPDELPELDGEAQYTAFISGTNAQKVSMPSGSYMIKVTVTDKATGSVAINVVGAN